MLTDYHVHLRPDERAATPEAFFTEERIRLYLDAAEAAGIAELGISEHIYRFRQALTVWDHPFWREWAEDDLDDYCAFLGASPVRCGIEADFVPGREAELEALLDPRSFDYVIGSVHFLGERSIDTEEFSIWEDGTEPDEVWRRYFETLAEAARSGLYDIIAHPDLVKVWGRAGHLPSVDPRHFYEPAVEAIAGAGLAVEVSTAGLRKQVKEIYPAPDFLELCVAARIPISLSSDAHQPDQVGYRYDLAIEQLGRAGVEEIAVFEDRQRSSVPLGVETGAGCQ